MEDKGYPQYSLFFMERLECSLGSCTAREKKKGEEKGTKGKIDVSSGNSGGTDN